MTKLTHFGCAALLLCASNLAWAGGETGFYVGASAGSAGIDVSYTQSGVGDVSYDDDASAYKAFLGYNFGIIPLINLAVEASYVDFGTAKGSVSGNNAETKVTGVDAFGLVGFNLGPVSLFAKAGAIDWDSESTVQSSTSKESGTDPAYGVGLQMQFGSLGIRAEYEVFDLEVVDIGFASVGVSYTF
jgi:hypothetical protein